MVIPHASARMPPPLPTQAWLRRLPILLILGAAILGAVALRDELSFEALARHREALLAFRDAQYLWSVLIFLLAYVALVALSLPGGTVATLTGGFLFGLFPGVLYNVAAAGTGAILVFLAARIRNRRSPRAETGRGRRQGGAAEESLRANEWSILFLVLVPLVPFFIANLIPAFVGTSLPRFAVSTYIGIIPGALVFTSVGAGLGEVFARGAAPDLGVIFTPPVLFRFSGLAALAALPMLLRAVRGGRQ